MYRSIHFLSFLWKTRAHARRLLLRSAICHLSVRENPCFLFFFGLESMFWQRMSQSSTAKSEQLIFSSIVYYRSKRTIVIARRLPLTFNVQNHNCAFCQSFATLRKSDEFTSVRESTRPLPAGIDNVYLGDKLNR